MKFSLSDHPHRRYNPLTGEWVIVSPHRLRRPWQGQTETPSQESHPPYEPTCYLCPGNGRAGGARNPIYTGTFVFDNDFPGLMVDTSPGKTDFQGLLVAEAERGICRVVCFSPRHDLTLPQLDLAALRRVVDTWAAQTEELGARPWVNYVLIFENKGAMMGCSNPHPHGQIWATEHLPNEPGKESAAQLAYLAAHGSCLLCDYLAVELAHGERLVCANDHFVALVPFWAIWPFETMILSRRHVSCLTDLDDAERDALADVLKRLTTRYDNLFHTSFPYSMGFHQRPTDGSKGVVSRVHTCCHLHAHFYPPLLRSATVRKFMVGFEMLGTPQRDITAETSAERLRAQPERHYRQ